MKNIDRINRQEGNDNDLSNDDKTLFIQVQDLPSLSTGNAVNYDTPSDGNDS